jgi:CTP:molybdopterin cytidylyltransferase MocA
MVRWSTLLAVRSVCNPVFVIAGHREEPIYREESSSHTSRPTPLYPRRMSTSIVAGVREVIGVAASGRMICLADIPLLMSDHLTGFSRAFLDAEARCSLGLRTRGPGHQIICPRRALHDLLSWAGDVGGCEMGGRYAHPRMGR